jgi:hypothetical protein
VASESRHVSERIGRPAQEVYAYASDPANLPYWAPGLGSAVEQVDGQWFVDTPDGRVSLEFAPHNAFGVLDHDVTLPSGETVYNPVRVFPYGDGSEIVFTVRRRDGMTDEDFAADAGAVAADLSRLKTILESSAGETAAG